MNGTTTLSGREPLKSMVFRIPETLKTDFRIVLMKNHADVQHTLEAFAEALIEYDQEGEKNPIIKNILKRAQVLTQGV